ncbi:MAG: PPOX class F420-dependent oxidoreductase [Actinomycetota bacterium]|nr:PPOX class F420-dependent oxidoreductase [Actinomycetota bacterium]
MPTLTPEQAQLLLDRNLAHVATLRPDGSPHLTVTWIDWDGENVLLNTAYGRAKPRHLQNDPRIAVGVVDANDPYRYVSISGTAELVDEGAREHIDKLSARYTGRETFPLPPGEKRVIIRVRPEKVDAHGFAE